MCYITLDIETIKESSWENETKQQQKTSKYSKQAVIFLTLLF